MGMNVIKSIENISTLNTDEKAAISEFVGNLRKRFSTTLKEIIIFGSKVRGNSERESDIDILIVLDKLTWEIKKTISELAAQENIKFGVLISTVRYDVTTWENPVVKATPFYSTIRKEGVQL